MYKTTSSNSQSRASRSAQKPRSEAPGSTWKKKPPRWRKRMKAAKAAVERALKG
jgi:hypothetical protein